MQGKVRLFYKNNRYKLITVNDEAYIVDNDRPISSFAFCFLLWMLPLKAWHITDQDLISELIESNPKRNIINLSNAMIGGISVLGGKIGAELTKDFVYEFNLFNSWLILIISILFVCILRIYMSYRNREKMNKCINRERLEVCKIRIKPQSSKIFNSMIFSFLITLIMIFLGAVLFIVGNHMVGLLTCIVFFFILLIFNSTLMKDGEIVLKLKK